MKKLYIIRHGQTEYNSKGMVQGSGIDAPLNETGRLQADTFYQAYKYIPFDKIYVSSLIRTQQTVQQFIDQGVPFEALKDLREISWGVQEGVAFTPETSSVYQETCKAWTDGQLDLRIEGGETPMEVATRQQAAMTYILEQPGDAILICIHGRAMRIMMCWMLGYSLNLMDNFPHVNTGLYLVNWDGSKYSVEWFNETAHIGS